MIYVYSLKKELKGTYSTIAAAASATGLTPMLITEALQGKYKTIKGLVLSGKELSKR